MSKTMEKIAATWPGVLGWQVLVVYTFCVLIGGVFMNLPRLFKPLDDWK